jgi:integrase
LTGKQFRVSARTDRELQSYLHHIDQLREGLQLGTKSEDEVDRSLRRLVHGRVTVERAATAYVEQAHLALNTRKAMRSFVRGAGAPIASRELAELSAPVVEGWLLALRSRVSSGSGASYWWRLRSLVRFAHAREWIGRSPWGSWRPVFRGRKRVRDRESARDAAELARLFEAARELDADRAARGLLADVEAKIVTFTVLGLRQGEGAGLRWPDLDAAAGLVTIARQYDGAEVKGKKAKRLRAAGALFELLDRHRDELARAGLYAPDGPIFPSAHRSRRPPASPRAYTQGECLTRLALRAVVTRAHLPRAKQWSPHSLRDTFATLEAAAHEDLPTLQQRTRHESLSSLLRYLRAAQRDPPPPAILVPRLAPDDRPRALPKKNARR